MRVPHDAMKAAVKALQGYDLTKIFLNIKWQSKVLKVALQALYCCKIADEKDLSFRRCFAARRTPC